MAATAVTPEVLDLDILREMYRGGAISLAGIDPRLNVTRIARRLKVGRARVDARLQAWKKSGFLRRYEVWVNPALFGWEGAFVAIRVEDRREKSKLMPCLGLVDGIVSGTEFLGEWITVGLIAPDAASLERRVALIRELPGVREVESPTRWHVPRPKRALTSLDLRIIRSLRERPMATLGETAHRAGVSTRTMTRRYSELIEGWAVWFVPLFDFRSISYPVVTIGVTVRPGVRAAGIAHSIRARFPLTLDLPATQAAPDVGGETQVWIVIPPSAAHLEEIEQFVESIDGVVSVEANVMVRVHSFPEWFDDHLRTLMKGRSETTRVAR
ncbi:MAG: Lrp/AsnC family transcriptional regulator [Thermoplasmata archaeon]